MSIAIRYLSSVAAIVAAFIVLAVLLALAAPRHPPPPTGPPPEIVERLRRQQADVVQGDDRGPISCELSPVGPSQLRVTLTNTSDRPATIWYYSWPQAHVTFLIRDPEGTIAATFHWGLLSSQAVSEAVARELPTLSLRPGESHTACIELETLREEVQPRLKERRYAVEAVFVYDDHDRWPDGQRQHFVARSGAVAFEIVGEEGSWKLGPLP